MLCMRSPTFAFISSLLLQTTSLIVLLTTSSLSVTSPTSCHVVTSPATAAVSPEPRSPLWIRAISIWNFGDRLQRVALAATGVRMISATSESSRSYVFDWFEAGLVVSDSALGLSSRIDLGNWLEGPSNRPPRGKEG